MCVEAISLLGHVRRLEFLMPTAGDIMTTNVFTIRPDCTIHDAIQILLEQRISGLPVTNEGGELVGIVTEFALLAIAYDQRISNDTVANHMTHDVLTVDVDAPVRKAADLCIIHRVRRVPVMENGKLAGLISRRDVLKAIYEEDYAACA